MSQIHIADGQLHEILDFITAPNIISDDHKKSLEDTLETYTFITFADKRFSEFLEKRNRIIIPDENDSLVEFVIFEAHKYKDTEGHKAQVFAHASYLELKKASILYPSTFEGTASQHGGRALNNTGWQIGIVESSGTRTLTIESHTNPYEMLKRIANEFGLELRFRIEHDGNKITGRYVDLLERVGEWRGREVEFGKDLDGIRRIEKQDIVTALLGLGPEDENGQRLEVLVEDDEALQRWGWIDEHGNLNHWIEPYEIQSERSEMTETEARQYTRTALDKRINTQVTFETTIVDLEEVPGMENKKIRFGDTIKIKDTHFNPPLYLEARVFEQTRSIKSKAKKDIKLGDFIEHTEEEVNAIWKQLQKQIQNRVSYYEMVEHTYDRLTIDTKDETVFTEGKTFAEAVGIDAKEYAESQDALIKKDVEQYADGVAQSALDAAKMYAVAQEVYDIQMQQIASDISDRAPIEYVDGQLVDKANVGDVYTISDVDNMINNTVSVTKYTTDMQGIVTDLNSHGTRIGQNEEAIGLKADSSDLNAMEQSLTTQIGNVEVKADAVEISVSEVRADLDGLEIGGRNLITLNSVTTSDATVNGYKYTIVGTETNRAGIRIPHTLFENNTEYVITFKVKKISGTVFSMAGHVESIPDASSTITILDGEEISRGRSWAKGNQNHPDDTEMHQYEIRFKTTSNVSGGGNAKFWYIQPNRNTYGENYVLEIWDFQLEKGNKATDWSPAPEDADEAISNVSGRVETLDGEITALAGEVSLKASQSVVDSLEGRVSTAESELSVLPGEINAKISKDGAFGELNLSPDTALLNFNRVKMTGELEAKHIKSLAGLNVNDQFVVDKNGKVTIGNDRVTIDDVGIQIKRPDGAIALSDGLTQVGYGVVGNDPNYMTAGRVVGSGVTFNAFQPSGTYIQNAAHIYGGVKGSLDGRGLTGDTNSFTDVRDSMSALAVQKYEFTHSSRYLVFSFRKYAGSKFSVHVMKGQSANLDDRIFFQLFETDTAGLHKLVVDLGTPIYNVRTVTFKIGWTVSWGDRMENIRFIMESVYLTDFI